MNFPRHETMDRPIDPGFVRKRRRKRIIQFSALAIVLVAVFMFFSAWIAPSVPRDQIRTAVVDSGLVEAAISATGTVLPEFEEVISCPAETRLLQVIKHPGEKLAKGDQFLLLDLSGPKLDLERIEKDLSLKANKVRQLGLDEGHNLTDLESQRHIKELRLTYLKSKTAQQEKMVEIGASSKDQLAQTKLDEEIATTELASLLQTITNTRESLTNQLQGLNTEIATLRKERADIQKQIDILSCRAPQEGVLTMSAQDVGAAIHRGDIIARIAGLNGYRVEGTVSDIHSGELRPGLRTHILWTGGETDGVISNIFPSIENGTVRFAVALSQKSDPRLRANLRVDVSVITANKGRSLRLAKGPYLAGGGTQELFVVHGNSARRTTANIGVAGFDYVEITGGLNKGDEVIISDMREYLHVQEVRLK